MAEEKPTTVQVDASIPLRAGDVAAPANPLTQYGDVLKLQGAINQNQLFPGQLKQQEQSIQSNANALALQNRNAVYSHFSSAMADSDPTLDKVTTLMGVAAKNGFNVQPAIQDLHETFPVAGTAAERRQWIASRVGATLSPSEQVANATPRFGGFIDTGLERVPFATEPALGPNAGKIATGGNQYPVYPSRSEQIGQVQGAPEPESGAPTNETLADRIRRQGRSDLLGPSGGAAPNSTQAPTAAPATQRTPPPIAGLPSAAPRPTPAPAPGAAVPVGLPPGTAEAATRTAGSSADMGQALTQRSDLVNTNKAQYSTLLDDLGRLSTMGPGTEREVHLNAVMQKLTGYGVTMNKEQVAGAESFGKIANQIALAQAGTLGATDQRVQSTMGANPHLDMSKLGNERVIHMLQGNEDAIAAKNAAWQNWITPKSQKGLGNGTGTYGQFSTQFNKDFDPRVYQSKYMTPAEISEMRRSMSADQQREFLRRARDAGVLN